MTAAAAPDPAPARHVVHTFFAEVARARAAGVHAQARSHGDKEYFIQDWVRDRAQAAGLNVVESGRNSYPDFWLTDDNGTRVGVEVKSLALTRTRAHPDGRAARTDLDFNSTPPSPTVDGHPCLLAFALYEKTEGLQRPVHTFVLADMRFVNAVPIEHSKGHVDAIGSFGDGYVRNRKMYVFDHPVTLAARLMRPPLSLLGRDTLIETATFEPKPAGLDLVATIERAIADERLAGYTVPFGRGEIVAVREPHPDAGARHIFDVWTPRPRMAGAAQPAATAAS